MTISPLPPDVIGLIKAALAEDVAEQAHGALQQQAREWLAARA